MTTKKRPGPTYVWVRTVKEPQVLQMKITLLYLKPLVWRRFLILNNETLCNLRVAVQIVMGWQDSHLDCFTVGNDRYSISRSHMGEDFGLAGDKPAEPAVLAYTLPKPGEPFYYTYDFGDSWEHELVVEKVLPIDPEVDYPCCLKGARACPPEDCGGPPGYMDLLQVLKKPKHEEYQDMLEWLGKKFDPKTFDLDKVNKQLRRTFSPLPKRRKSPRR